ncbi:hypothetical protein V8E54_000169 [Elaphomyces granulatus]
MYLQARLAFILSTLAIFSFFADANAVALSERFSMSKNTARTYPRVYVATWAKRHATLYSVSYAANQAWCAEVVDLEISVECRSKQPLNVRKRDLHGHVSKYLIALVLTGRSVLGDAVFH